MSLQNNITEHNGRFFINQNYVYFLSKNNLLIPAGQGGLLMGDSHDFGGVHVAKIHSDNSLEIIAEIEGWEYIVNSIMFKRYKETIEGLNNEFRYTDIIFETYPVPENITVIDASSPLVIDGIVHKPILVIMLDGIFIVNKHSTKKYLHLLEKINSPI